MNNKYTKRYKSSAKKLIFFFLKKIKLYVKKRLKKDINIKNENVIILRLLFNKRSKLLNGIKPPDEINVMDRLSESKVLIFIKLSVKKMKIVKQKYNNKIFKDCLKDSKLLNEI